MGGTCSTHGADRRFIQNLVGKPEGKRPLGRTRRRYVDNIRMDIWAMWWEGVNWIHRVQDRDQWRTVVNTVMNLRVT